MPADVQAARIAHNTATTTAKTVALTDRVLCVSVRNRDDADSLYVAVRASSDAAVALAAVVATPATVGGDDCFVIPPGGFALVHSGGIPEYVALSIIASAGTAAYSVTGTMFDQF